jgi:hypothetical protein
VHRAITLILRLSTISCIARPAKMAFGILDCKKLENVPGTSFMSDQEDLPPEYAEIPRDALKHGKGRFSNLILIPQPSDSPNDPLNWPQWKKELILIIVGLEAAVVGAFG